MADRTSISLIFDGNAETAIDFYRVLFRDQGIERMAKSDRPKILFRLNEQEYRCVDSVGSDPVSTAPHVIHIPCPSKKDMDVKSVALAEDGKILAHLRDREQNRYCTRIRDRFGVIWQLYFRDISTESYDLNLCFANNKDVRPEYKL